MPPTSRVLLIGMMGAGKSTVGRAVAARTGWPYLDNDELVERAAGRPTAEVLSTSDEQHLRLLERSALEEALCAPTPLVAGVAAGTVLDPECRERMRADAFVVYLRAPLDVLAARVGEGEDRPWLAGDPAGALADLLEGREPLYESVADLVLDVGQRSPAELAAVVVEAVPS